MSDKTEMEPTPETTTMEVVQTEVLMVNVVNPPPPVTSLEVETEKEDERNPPLPITLPDVEKEKKEEVETATETAVVEERVSSVEVAVTEAREKGESSMVQSASFKEESNRIKDLNEREKKALDELKELIVAALAKHEFSMPPPPPSPPRVKEDTKDVPSEEVVSKKVEEAEAIIEEESKKEAVEEEEISKKEESKKERGEESKKEEENHREEEEEEAKKEEEARKEEVAIVKEEEEEPKKEEVAIVKEEEEEEPKKEEVAIVKEEEEEEPKKEEVAIVKEEEEEPKKEEVAIVKEEEKEPKEEEGEPMKEEEPVKKEIEPNEEKEEEEPKKEKDPVSKEESLPNEKSVQKEEEEPKKEKDLVCKEESLPNEEKSVQKEEEESNAEDEPVKKEEDELKEKEEPTKPEASTEPVATAEKVEKRVVSMPLAAALAKEKKEEEEEDSTKTVEAIKETFVQVPVTDVGTASDDVVVEVKVEEEKPLAPEEVIIWGIPLIGDEQSDTLLLKFLRARDFKVKDTFTMIKNIVMWRKEFGIEELLNEDLGLMELERVVFTHGLDKEGHPVCYNVYGAFQDKDLYHKAFGDEEKRRNFLRWRVQVLEKDIREKLDFSPGSICTLVQVTDLKNSPGLGKKELRQATKQALTLLQDNYPELVAKQIFINVSWWYLAFNKMIAPLFTMRTKSKFVFAGPSRSAETLLKYIAPEQVPVQYGGLSAMKDTEFCTSDVVTDISIKPSTKHIIEIPAAETCTLVWELRVLGWEVDYGAEFVPDSESAYTVIIQKSRKFIVSDEPVIKNNFKIGEPGKVVITVDNATSKKKRLFYRYKTKTSTD